MRPVVICSSQRFKEPLEAFVRFLRKQGVLVFAPNFRRHTKRLIQRAEYLRLRSSTYRAKVPGLVWAHFNNLELIRGMGGLCLVFNPLPMNGQKRKFGYIGSNTQGEIGFCASAKLPVILLRPHEEEWIMTVAHQSDHNRVFSLKYPKADPMDFDFIWKHWLKEWLK